MDHNDLYSWEIFTNRFSLNMCVRLAPYDQVFLFQIIRNLNTEVREPMDKNLSECFLPVGFTLVLASGGLPPTKKKTNNKLYLRHRLQKKITM